MNFALVSASWHSDLVSIAKNACAAELRERQAASGSNPGSETDANTAEAATIQAGAIDEFTVPGSLEIPLFAQKLAQSGKYNAILAFGLIVDGGIYRHEFVANAVISGLVRVQLDTGVPVFSCILTPQAFHEHEEHHRFFQQNLVSKGKEAAKACLAFLHVLEQIPWNGA